MKLLILANGVGFGGRGKALLSLCDYLWRDINVSVVSDEFKHIHPRDIPLHHGIHPDIEWEVVDWDSTEPSEIFDSHSPDVVLGFDSPTNSYLSEFDGPTIAYCRRGISNWADEFWTPSKMMAERHNAWLRERDYEDNCYAIYPIWYIEEPDSVRPFNEREIDVLVHSRKAEGVDLSDYRVHYADGHNWDELTDIYQNSKIFLFPTKPRFEPLGLMPIEAAAYGCHLALPRNAGVSEIFPHSVYRQPQKAIPELLSEDDTSDLSIPSSPTDPIERLLSLARGQERVTQ